jgi:hypothetical protein
MDCRGAKLTRDGKTHRGRFVNCACDVPTRKVTVTGTIECHSLYKLRYVISMSFVAAACQWRQALWVLSWRPTMYGVSGKLTSPRYPSPHVLFALRITDRVRSGDYLPHGHGERGGVYVIL